jgi:hypothetical protein
MKTIGVFAFVGCTALTSLTLPAVPPKLEDNVFTDTNNTTPLIIHVPNGAVAAYTAAPNETNPPSGGWGVESITDTNVNEDI